MLYKIPGVNNTIILKGAGNAIARLISPRTVHIKENEVGNYTTIGDLIKALSEHDPNIPVLGFSATEDCMEVFTSINLLGVYGETIKLQMK